MSEPGNGGSSRALESELEELRARYEEAQETLASIRRGDVDALLIGPPGSEQVYTLTTAERPYRVMVEQMKEGAVTLSPEGTILYANQSFASAVGRPLEQVIDRDLASFLEHDDDAFRELLRPAGGKIELDLRHADGRSVPAAISTTEIVDPEGGERTYCAVVTDLTHHRHHERLRRSERRLQEVDRRKDEFLAMLGHELRNPLAPILHAVEILRHDLDGAGDRPAWALGVIGRQLAHMRRIVDDLLDIGRITRGAIELRRRELRLSDVVTAAVEAVRPQLEARRHELRVELAAEGLWVDGDPVRLAQVVGNLLDNAAKYTSEGGHLEIAVRREGGYGVIRVRDDGDGIRDDLLPQVFDLFTRGAGPGEGLGLGLTVVRRLVEMHDGEVTAESAGLGHGSTFCVRLPLVARPAAAAAEADQAAGDRGSRRVLVVDDNEDAARALALLLGRAGHDVRTAADGVAALEAAEAFHPEVVCLDIGLPGMDGYEVARRLRRRSNGPLRLIAITGFGQEQDAERSRAAGIDHHVVKPVAFREIEKLLHGA